MAWAVAQVAVEMAWAVAQVAVEHSGQMCHPVVTPIGSATVHWLFTIVLIAAAAGTAAASGYLAYRLSGLGRS